MGAPDYLIYLNKIYGPLIHCFHFIDLFNSLSNDNPNVKNQFLAFNQKKRSESDIKVNTIHSLGPYLAGLLEGFLANFYTSHRTAENTKDYSKVERNMKYITDGKGPIPASISEILIGLLLGDLHASKAQTKNTSFLFEQGEIHTDYLFHLYEIFKDYCKTEPKISSRFDKRTNKTYTRVKFSTLTSPLFNYYYNLFYVNDTKIIPANLGELLTARGIAYWAMDDGSKSGSGFILNTQSFTKDENLFLIKILKENFDLDCVLHLHSTLTNQYRIYIKANSMHRFRELVSPYFHTSMLYKLDMQYTNQPTIVKYKEVTSLLLYPTNQNYSNGQVGLGLPQPLSQSQFLAPRLPSQYFNSYLAGLFDAKGYIGLSKMINSKGKISYPYIAITFVNKDLPLVLKLIEKYGGRLRFKNKENAIVWIINKHEHLIKLIELMNGYLRTPKIIKFNELISWLNKKYSYNISVYSPDMSDLNLNGWLAGFIDADGGFKVRYTEKRIDELTNKVLTKGRIEVRFALEQRQILLDCTQDSSYEPIMLKIQSFFGLKTDLRVSKHNIDKIYWIIEVTSLNKLHLLNQYLNNFPLLTAKRNDYDDWLKVYHLMQDNRHLTEEGKLLIKEIKSTMNKKREIFNWDHLIYLNNIQ